MKMKTRNFYIFFNDCGMHAVNTVNERKEKRVLEIFFSVSASESLSLSWCCCRETVPCWLDYTQHWPRAVKRISNFIFLRTFHSNQSLKKFEISIPDYIATLCDGKTKVRDDRSDPSLRHVLRVHTESGDLEFERLELRSEKWKKKIKKPASSSQ